MYGIGCWFEEFFVTFYSESVTDGYLGVFVHRGFSLLFLLVHIGH